MRSVDTASCTMIKHINPTQHAKAASTSALDLGSPIEYLSKGQRDM